MGKYFTVFKTSFKQETKTIVNSLIAVASFAVIIFIFFELWSYIYGGEGGGSLINGYDLNMMIWYMIMAEILMYAQNSVTITRTFGNDIKSGKVAYGLNKPYNYFTYQVSNQTGVFVYKLLFLIPTGIILGLILLGLFGTLYLADLGRSVARNLLDLPYLWCHWTVMLLDRRSHSVYMDCGKIRNDLRVVLSAGILPCLVATVYKLQPNIFNDFRSERTARKLFLGTFRQTYDLANIIYRRILSARLAHI